jgi:hypothetical protein
VQGREGLKIMAVILSAMASFGLATRPCFECGCLGTWNSGARPGKMGISWQKSFQTLIPSDRILGRISRNIYPCVARQARGCLFLDARSGARGLFRTPPVGNGHRRESDRRRQVATEETGQSDLPSRGPTCLCKASGHSGRSTLFMFIPLYF